MYFLATQVLPLLDGDSSSLPPFSNIHIKMWRWSRWYGFTGHHFRLFVPAESTCMPAGAKIHTHTPCVWGFEFVRACNWISFLYSLQQQLRGSHNVISRLHTVTCSPSPSSGPDRESSSLKTSWRYRNHWVSLLKHVSAHGIQPTWG